jgi:hypothetical protein
VVDWTELAMLITIEIAKESGQKGEVIMTNRGNELTHFAKSTSLKP